MAGRLISDWKEVASGKYVGSDLLAGLTVAAVALPLNLALGVASGLPPAAGLVAGAVGGLVAAALGGASLQVTGPAAALSSMVAALVAQFGASGAAAAALVVGVVQLGLAFGRAGALARLVPEAVLAGFTTGVGVKLLDGQLPELLGFNYRVVELAQMMHRPAWLHEVSWLSVVCGLGVAFLVVTTRPWPRFPAALVGVGLVTALSNYLGWEIERVGEVPNSLPSPGLPLLADDRWLDLALATVPLALLAAVESLLSAKALDRMKPDRKPHEPNLELFGQGLANLAVGFMQGLPVTGVVVRSGVNAQSGGRTRLSAMVHGGVLVSAVLLLSTQIARIPLAGLAGLLLVIAMRLIEVSTFIHLLQTARWEALAFAVTCAGTMTGHLVSGLVGGLVVAMFGEWLHRDARKAASEQAARRAQGVRAVIAREQAEARKPQTWSPPPESQAWLKNLRAGQGASRAPSAFVHPNASVIGEVVLGERVHIAAESSVRADEGAPFFIGPNTNVQDGVVIHALKEKYVNVGGEPWAVYVGKNVSLAHDALVHGPCYVGDDTFVGFKAVVHDSIVGSGCYVGIGAVVVGVEVPDGRYVPHGMIVSTAEAAQALPPVTDAHRHFNEDVVDVNRGLADAYRAHHGIPAARQHHAPTGVRLIGDRTRDDDSWGESWRPVLDADRF